MLNANILNNPRVECCKKLPPPNQEEVDINPPPEGVKAWLIYKPSPTNQRRRKPIYSPRRKLIYKPTTQGVKAYL